MVPKDQRFTNLKVDETLLVGRALVVPRIQTAELVVTSENSAKVRDLTVDDLTVLNTIVLPTPGGSASALNFYQVLSTSVDFTSGAFSGTQMVPVKLTRIGDSVTANIGELSVIGNGSTGTFLSTAIPAQFRPAQNLTGLIWVTDNNTDMLGRINVNVSGTLSVDRGSVIGAAVENAVFTGGAGLMGFNGFSLSWCV